MPNQWAKTKIGKHRQDCTLASVYSRLGGKCQTLSWSKVLRAVLCVLYKVCPSAWRVVGGCLLFSWSLLSWKSSCSGFVTDHFVYHSGRAVGSAWSDVFEMALTCRKWQNGFFFCTWIVESHPDLWLFYQTWTCFSDFNKCLSQFMLKESRPESLLLSSPVWDYLPSMAFSALIVKIQ